MFKSRLLLFLLPCLWLSRYSVDGEGGGGNIPNPVPSTPSASGLTQADIDKAVQAALTAQAADFSTKLKQHTGHESFDGLSQAEAIKRGEYEKLIGEKDSELSELRSQISSGAIQNALLSASSAAIDPAVIVSLLAGNGKFENGQVTIGGKSPADAVAELLNQKPFLAKSGPAGSGSPLGGDADGSVTNPWAAETFNLTAQGKIEQENPTLAQKLKAQAKKK